MAVKTQHLFLENFQDEKNLSSNRSNNARRRLIEESTIRLNLLRSVVFGAIIFLSACSGKLVGVNVTVVDQKTALENQILGSYEELGNEMLVVASVRLVDEEGKLKTIAEILKSKKTAIRAMQRQEFNKDDIQKFKQTGCAGEGNEGLLVFFENEETQKTPNTVNLFKPSLKKKMKTVSSY